MNNRRAATSTIWRTVVFAGAMLGAGAATTGCKKGSDTPATTPTNAGGDTEADSDGDGIPDAEDDDSTDPCAGDPCAGDPCGDPCSGRIRGDEEGEGGGGRGFVLS